MHIRQGCGVGSNPSQDLSVDGAEWQGPPKGNGHITVNESNGMASDTHKEPWQEGVNYSLTICDSHANYSFTILEISRCKVTTISFLEREAKFFKNLG